MKNQFRLTVALFLLALFQPFAFSQDQPAPIALSPSCNNGAAVEIIQQQLAETRTYDDDERRITVLIRSADLLWPYLQERSRAASIEAFDLSIQYFKENGDRPKQDGAQPDRAARAEFTEPFVEPCLKISKQIKRRPKPGP